MMSQVTKYFVEIQTDPNTGYSPNVGWDVLYSTKQEADGAAQRARQKFIGARVGEMEVPAHVDHLYRNLCDKNDTTSLYS